MAVVSIRGKDNILKYFKNTNNPYWKLYNATGSKSPIQAQTQSKDRVESGQWLEELIDSLDPLGTYTLDTYAVGSGEEKQRFIHASTSTTFTLSEQAVGSTQPEKQKDPGGFTMHNPANFKDHMDLVRENTRLTIELAEYKSKCDSYLKRISELQEEVGELNDELDEIDEEDEEEESESKVSGVPKNMEEALAKVLADNGAVLIENLTGKKIEGDPGKPLIDEDPTEETKINGVQLPAMEVIIGELQKHDKHLQTHLYKLMLVARQKPATFQMILSKLEDI